MLKPVFKCIAMASLMLFAMSSAVYAASPAKKHNVVIQVTDNNPAKWNQALNNAANLQKAIGKKNIDVEIVVNGPGLGMMMFDSPVANRLSKELKSGIVMLACGATMKAKKVKAKDLHDGVKVVPGGVIEIMKRQEAGWTYIKI